MHKRHGQLGFHFLILFLKHVKELESFIFSGIKKDKKDTVSVLYLTVFGLLVYNSLRILKSHGIASLTSKTSFNIVGDRSCSYL